jgi:hypothetical protein
MELPEAMEIALKEAHIKYSYLAEGRNRAVFIKDEKWVVKVPLNDYGMSDNYAEERRYQKFGKTGDDIPYAECRVVHDTNGIPLLEMERVTLLTETDAVPKWADYVDCAQVGRTSSGEIVAYDYSDVG